MRRLYPRLQGPVTERHMGFQAWIRRTLWRTPVPSPPADHPIGSECLGSAPNIKQMHGILSIEIIIMQISNQNQHLQRGTAAVLLLVGVYLICKPHRFHSCMGHTFCAWGEPNGSKMTFLNCSAFRICACIVESENSCSCRFRSCIFYGVQDYVGFKP